MSTSNSNVFCPKMGVVGKRAVTCLSLQTADALQSASFSERVGVQTAEVS